MDDLLLPQNPDDTHTLFDLLLEELTEKIGARPEISRLALLGVRHLLGNEMMRLLLIGPTGVGKTFMARKLAEALGVPFLEFSVSHMAEEGWKGSGPSEHLSTLYDEVLLRSPSMEAGIRAVARAVILVDEMDKARRAPPSASASHRENRLGKQFSLLPLIGDGTIAIERGSGRSLIWRSRRALIICAGVFDGLTAEQPSEGHLEDWGLIPELAERLAAGLILRIPALDSAQVIHLYRSSLNPFEDLFSLFGYTLHISDEVLKYVAKELRARGAGSRAGMGILSAAAETTLLSLIEANAELGTVIWLSPDDVRIPEASKGIWRE